MKLADQTIYTFMQLIQIAMLTGTDVIDHFRMIELDCDEDNMINLSKDSQATLEDNINKMTEEANQMFSDDNIPED